MEISIRYELIDSLDTLRMFSKVYKEGIMMKPNISKLARTLNADRKTVRKALNGFMPSKNKTRTKYLDSYRDKLVELLTDEYREFEYYKHLYNFMVREENISCCYSSFKRYIQNDTELSKSFKKSKSGNKFSERFETEAGKQAQFDLKEKIGIIDTFGNKTKVNVATLTLGFSRNNTRKIVPDTSYDSVISFLAESFDELGGVPQQLVIDNIKCLIDTPRRKGKEAVVNSKFIEFLKDYNLELFPCMPGRPETKGKTETQNKIPSQLKNYNGQYADLHEVHDILNIINTEDNESISQGTNLPAVFLLKYDKKKLNKLPSNDIKARHYLKLKEVIVSNESLISYKSNKYSVPKQYIGKHVGRIVKNNKLHIYYSNKIVTIHVISNKKLNIKESHQLIYGKRLELKEESKNIIIEEMEMINYDND